MIDNRKATVSLLMIVRNEERQLADCLSPVAGLFDEIIVVDTGSQDATKQIASRFSSRVFDFPWGDDFSAARNESLRQASGEWVFWLDADDRLTPENVARLRTLLAQLDQTPRAYIMDTASWAEHACERFTLVSHPRLFRRHSDLCWEGRVHEQLRSRGGDLQLEAVWCDVRIDHYGYQNRALQQRKLQRNVRLLRMDYAVDPDNHSTRLHLGLAYFHLGRWEDARTLLASLISDQRSPREHLRQVYSAVANIALKQGDPRQALATLEAGLVSFPSDEYLLYLRAECLYEIDDYDGTAKALVQILSNPQSVQYQGAVPGEIKDRLAPRKLADVYRLKREFGTAEALLRSLVSRDPDDTLTWNMLGLVYLDWQRRDQLLAVVERLRACPQGDVFGALLMALWNLAQQDLAAASERIDWLITQAPQMSMPRLLRAELLARIGAPIGDRILACRDILRVQPGNLDALRVLKSLETAQSAAANQWPVSAVAGVGTPVQVGTELP